MLYYITTLLCAVLVLLLVMYIVYNVFFPLAIKKGVVDIGYEHIANDRNRRLYIRHTMRTRHVDETLPPPYPDGWYAVLESSYLRPGDVVPANVLGENLVVYRRVDGTVSIVDAYCPHLGANMGVGGKVVDGCIECPFHKWRFASDTGDCVHVPGQEKAIRGVRVNAWISRESDGIVWLWYSSGGGDVTWQLEPSEQLKDGWILVGRNENIVNSHIQDIPENGADVAHLNAVHSLTVAPLMGDAHHKLRNIVGRHSWSAEWREVDEHTAEMNLSHTYKLFNKYQICSFRIQAKQLGPGSVVLTDDNLLVIQTVTPLAPLLQRVVHRVYVKNYMYVPIGVLFLWGEILMFERDVRIWNHKRYVQNPVYSKEDKNIKLFRQWYSKFYNKDSKTFAEATRQLTRDNYDW